MITKVIIAALKADSTLQTLLGGDNVFTTFNFKDTVDKQVNVSLDYGATVPFDCTGNISDGTVRVYAVVKDTVSEPISTLDNIVSRVLTVLDLKGSALDSTNYWLQKISTDFTHYKDLHYYELCIVFRFVSQK